MKKEELGATRKIPFSINQLLWRPLMIFPISNVSVFIPHFWFRIPGFDNSFSTLNRLSSIPNDFLFTFHYPPPPALLISINQLPIRPFIFWKSPHFFRTKWEEPGHCNVLYNSVFSVCGPGNTLYKKDRDWRTSHYLLLVGGLVSMYLIPLQGSIIFIRSLLIGS